MKRRITPSLRRYRVQEFKQAFCHKAALVATVSKPAPAKAGACPREARPYGKQGARAELIFEPYIFLMKG